MSHSFPKFDSRCHLRRGNSYIKIFPRTGNGCLSDVQARSINIYFLLYIYIYTIIFCSRAQIILHTSVLLQCMSLGNTKLFLSLYALTPFFFVIDDITFSSFFLCVIRRSVCVCGVRCVVCCVYMYVFVCIWVLQRKRLIAFECFRELHWTPAAKETDDDGDQVNRVACL